ncbi:hypothetical protein ACFE04_031584 [Oxalis oulophora]
MVVELKWKLGFLIQLTYLAITLTCCNGESSKCIMVYKEGGAAAVFQSPKCPRWTLPPTTPSDSRRRSSTTSDCQISIVQGWRNSQEDRLLCALDIPIPFPGKTGVKKVMTGLIAVFDGHNGAEASEMASKLLLDYFMLHTYFLLDATYSTVLTSSRRKLPYNSEHDVIFQLLPWYKELGQHELNFERFKLPVPANFDDSFCLEVLKEALLRAIHDIDAAFSKEASRNKLDSGTTATVVLLADGNVLVANIGDSKALLCSEKFLSPADAKGLSGVSATLLRLRREQRSNSAATLPRHRYKKATTGNGLPHFIVKQLTRDHHPDREDEKFRVEAAGGYVQEWGGVARVNGQLAVSRSIGDVSYKSFGVISAPEIAEWYRLTVNDTFLVVASDGLFEKLSSQNVCDILWDVHNHDTCSYSVAECLVDTALRKGTTDNVAAVVVPLDSTHFSLNLPKERCIDEVDEECQTREPHKLTYDVSGHKTSSDLVQLENAHPLATKFDRLLVEEIRGHYGCYFLAENLDEHLDYTLPTKADYQEDLSHPLPKALDYHYGNTLNVYIDHNMCLPSGTKADGVNDRCLNPEGLASFLGLLESIPFNDTGSDHRSTEQESPDMRYVLKKRFGRGSYGEVWLAFHWNCHDGGNVSSWSQENTKFPCNDSTTQKCHTDSPGDDLFILKRVMVERGHSVYLSGLREKHYGEVFLNASTCLGGPLSSEMSDSSFEETLSDFTDQLEMNESFAYQLQNPSGFENAFSNKFEQQKAVFEEGLNHIARYIESFESKSNEIWLVFCHEGISLSKLMYTVEEADSNQDNSEKAKHIQILHPSKWWRWLKTTEAGKEEMRNLIWQLLIALKSCHDRNITHRDIKPENMVICFEDQESGRCLKGTPTGDQNVSAKMRIIDFGSAIDKFTLKNLYGSTGPSRAEQTDEYAPPEAFLNSSWYQGPTTETLKYDMWSVGVVILEMIVGSPNVFQISALTRILLDHHLEGWNENIKELAYKLRSFMELCILVPGGSTKRFRTNHGGVSPASWKCSEEFFSQQIKSRDPLKIGFPNVLVLRLVRQLLLWDPEDRLSVDDALRHPYFQPPPNG